MPKGESVLSKGQTRRIRTALLAATYLTDYYAVAWLQALAVRISGAELLAASAFEAIASKRNPHTESEERLELGVAMVNALVAEGNYRMS